MSSDKSYFIKSFHIRLLGLDEGLVLPSKPKVVFLHGLLGNGQNWLPVARRLEEKFTVLLIDQRGHGKTGKVPGGYTPKDFANDLLSIADELGWERFSLVGHSLGARTGFNFASRFPERLEKLILEDMGPHKTGPASLKTTQMIESVPAPFASRDEAKTFFKEVFEQKHGKVLSDYLYSNVQRTEAGDFDWRFHKEGVLECLEIGKKRDFWPEYEQIQSPTLVIRGEKSEHLPRDVYKEMLSRNVNSSGVEIPGAGHWVHFDQFGCFVTQVDQFLSE